MRKQSKLRQTESAKFVFVVVVVAAVVVVVAVVIVVVVVKTEVAFAS